MASRSCKDFPLMTRCSLTTPHFSPDTSSLAKLAPFDWKETPKTHIFEVDIPGMMKEEVKVEIEEGRILQISGERKIEKEGTNHTWHRAERSYGKFTRRFKLPENSKMEGIRASMENGVLTVTIPREEKKKSEVKVVEISG